MLDGILESEVIYIGFHIWNYGILGYYISEEIIKIEEMYYAPKINMSTYFESKQQQILTLQQKITNCRITYQDMEAAKDRLNMLKGSLLALQREDHFEHKEVLKNSMQAVSELVKRKNRLQDELDHQNSESQSMCELHTELTSKKEKAYEFYQDACQAKEKLIERRQKKSQEICELEGQINIRRKQLSMEREIGEQLSIAKAELKSKTAKVNLELTGLSEQNKKARDAIRKQLDDISKLEHQVQKNELRIDNFQIKIEKEQKHAQNLIQKIQSSQKFMQRFSDDRLVYLKEAETAANIDGLLLMCVENNEKKQREQQECQEDINELDQKIQKASSKRVELNRQIAIKKENLKELKEKGFELKNILNSIFHQDSSVVKLIADKKVYDQPQQSPKKSQMASPAYKIKQDMMDLVTTSDNFFMQTLTNSS